MRKKTCPDCGGDGEMVNEETNDLAECERCEGMGEIDEHRKGIIQTEAI